MKEWRGRDNLTGSNTYPLTDDYITTATDDVAQQLKQGRRAACVRGEQRPTEAIEAAKR
jgi:hypothetical protein